MKSVSIVAVGTEITSGEILNRNSQWLSQQIESMGFVMALHLSVADDRKAMRDVFELAYNRSDLVVITGGLGPTSDDFTREVVAEFIDEKLVFREDVYNDLRKLYEGRGLPLREAHKQQCYFPQNAKLLANPVGTALGFVSEVQGKKIFVLPGPPREVEGVFEKDMRAILEKLRSQQNEQLIKWKILAIPESEVAEKIEPIVQKYKLRVGYRASNPYVIVKVWMPIKGAEEATAEINKALNGWVVFNGDQDLAADLLHSLQKFSDVRIVDEASGGKLAARFEPHIKDINNLRLECVSRTYHASENSRSAHAQLSVRLENGGYRVSVDLAGEVYSQKLILPYKIDPRSERGKVQIAEQAIWHWFKNTQ